MGARVLPETTDCTGRQAASYTSADRCLCDTLACGTALQSRAGTAPQVPIPTAPFPTASRGGARGRCCETEPGSVQSTPVREAKSTEFGRLEGGGQCAGEGPCRAATPPRRTLGRIRAAAATGTRGRPQPAPSSLSLQPFPASAPRPTSLAARCVGLAWRVSLVCARRDMTAAPSACVAPAP